MGRIRVVIWIVAAVAAGWFAYELFSRRPSELGALPALTLFLWAGLLLGISYSFPVGPPAIGEGDSSLQRLRKRMSQLLYWILGAVTLAVSVLVAFLTERAVSLALG